jgi:hypothetical protein
MPGIFDTLTNAADTSDLSAVTTTSSYLGKGEHLVAVKEVNVTEGDNPYFELILGDDQGRTVKDRIYFTMKSKKTGDIVRHWKYIRFSEGVVDDTNVRIEYFNNLINTNIHALNDLVGCQLRIYIDKQKRGVSIRKAESGEYYLWDMVADVAYEGAGNFASIEDSAQYIKDNELVRSYNEIKSYTSVAGMENAIKLQTSIQTGGNATGSNTGAGAQGKRPRATGTSL